MMRNLDFGVPNSGARSKWLAPLFMAVLSFVFYNQAVAQCNNAGNQYPGSTVTPTADTGFQDVISDNWAGEYAVIGVTSGDTYTFSTCAGDGFIPTYDTQLTLRDDLGGFIAYSDDEFGLGCGNKSRITWVATYTGTVQIHLNVYNCASNSINSNIRVERVSAGGGGGGSDCDFSGNPYGTQTAPAPGGSVNFGCSYAGEMATLNSVVAGDDFSVNSSVGTDYITVRQGTSGGAVVISGSVPVSFNAAVGGSYYVHIASNSSCGTVSSCRTVTVSNTSGGGGGGPANDDCVNATVIGDGAAPVDNNGSTGTDITSCAFNDITAVWYEYVATCTGTATASTCNDASFDTVLSVFDACGGSEIECNDDNAGAGCTGNTSQLTFSVTSGTSYWVRVAGYNGATGTGNLTMSCSAAPATCDNSVGGCFTPQWPTGAVPLDGSDAVITIAGDQYNSGEYSQISNVQNGDDYEFTHDDGSYITVYQGGVTGTLLGDGFSPLTVTSGDVTDMYVHWSDDATCATSCSGSFTTTVQCLTCAPAVSPCDAPNVINPVSLPISGEAIVCDGTNDFTSSNVANVCGSTSYYGGQEALYSFTPATTADYELTYDGVSWNGMMVYDGCPLTGTCMGNSQSTGATESLTLTLTAGVEYFIIFDVWPAPDSPCPATFSLEEFVPLSAPCTNEGFGQWPNTTLAAPTEGGVQLISGSSATGDYHLATLNAGDSYEFSTEEGDNYYTVTNFDGTVVENHGPEPHSFTPGATADYRIYIHDDNTCTFDDATFFDTFWECTNCPILGCTDMGAINYDPAATVDDGSCFYPITSCGPDTYDSHCYGNNADDRFYYEADGGTDLYIQLNGGQVESGFDDFYVYDNFDGTGTPLYTVSGVLDAGTILHSTTGQLMVQVTSDGSVNCGSNGYDPLDYTIRCAPPAANSACGSAQNLSVATYPATSNSLGSLWFVEPSADAVCAGNPGANMYYSFNLAETNTVIVNVNPFGGSDVVVEVLDACGGNTLACVNDNGAGGAESALVETLAAGTYIVRVHNVSGDLESQSSGSFLVNVQQLPFAGVQDNPNSTLYACNQTGFQLEDFVGATPQTTPGVLDYEWLVGEVGGGSQTTYQRGYANYVARCEWLGMEYGATYNVFVRVLWNLPVHGPTWSVYKGDFLNPNLPGAADCTIATAFDVTQTELRPNYTPTNAQGNDYALCDFAIAYNVSESENFEWRFDPDLDPNNGNEIFYTRGTGNPSVRLSWVNNLTPGLTYNVAVRVQVAGQWSLYGTVLPLTLALPPNDVQLRSAYCGGTYSPNAYILSESVCDADLYQFRFTPTGGGTPSFRNSGNYVCFMSAANPALTPGDYDVQVKVTQNGVPGDWGPVCTITIVSPQGQDNQTPALRDIEAAGSAMLFPNPNGGDEVRMNLDGLSDGNHDVMIQVYDVFGKLISNEGFGHEGNSLSRLIRFDGNLATGMYMVQITVDGERFATERLIVK